jgi:hypothetical protein
MLKKEINDVLKQILLFTSVCLLLPALLIVTTKISDQSYFSVFFPMFQFGLIFGAFFMGASLFSLEHGQRGMEYLLSLPYSRLRLIGLKIIPRLAAVLIFFVIFLILHNSGGEDLAALPFAPFTAVYFFLFLISLSLSANSENFLVLFVVSFFSTFICFGLIALILRLVLLIKGIPVSLAFFTYFFHWERAAEVSALVFLVGSVLLLPFLISFFLSFKKFDIRPAKVYNKRYFKYFTPIVSLCFIISLLFVFLGSGPMSKQYYLTQDLKLVESIPYSGIKIYEADKVHEIKGDFDFWSPTLEDNEYVYDLSFDKIVRLDTSDYTAEVLYEVPADRKIAWYFCKYDQTIACVERERKKDFYDIQLVLVDEASKEVTRIPLENILQEKSYVPIHIWTDKTNGNRFWLISTAKHRNNQILRIWEDGRIENIGESHWAPSYINQTLITYTEEDIIISREKDGRFEAVRKIPNSKGFQFGIGIRRANLSNVTFKEIFGWRKGPKQRILAKLNLETFEIEEIGETKGYMFYFSPDEIYIMKMNHTAAAVKIHEFIEGKLNLLKTFTDFDTRDMTNRFRLCRGGVVIREGKKVRVYAFPDLREIKFKKL